ncbi:MAG: orotidine-5'-phosphate decarboxylase [Bacteroidota bacterium]
MDAAVIERIRTIQSAKHSVLCVGLDPDPARLPPHLLAQYALPDAIRAFQRAIIAATAPFACAFKVNFAFYEALGADGWTLLSEARAQMPADTLAIADAKRGDIGNTARFYARSIFEQLGYEAITVAPYMGRDAVLPFLEHAGTLTFVLARTSNPSGTDLQTLQADGRPIYQQVAHHVAQWNQDAPGQAGLVAGATQPDDVRALRAACPSLPFLIPGVGAQGGDPIAIMDAAQTAEGLVLVNSSRSILYASRGPNFADHAAQQAASLATALGPPTAA